MVYTLCVCGCGCGGPGGCAWVMERGNLVKKSAKGLWDLRIITPPLRCQASATDAFLHMIVYSLLRLKRGQYSGGQHREPMVWKQKIEVKEVKDYVENDGLPGPVATRSSQSVDSQAFTVTLEEEQRTPHWKTQPRNTTALPLPWEARLFWLLCSDVQQLVNTGLAPRTFCQYLNASFSNMNKKYHL